MQQQKFEEIKRKQVNELDEILGKPFKVLDDGFVRVVDYMGSDESIVQSARVSYGKGTKKVREDITLIRYLMRHRHTTPFEMCEITLHVRVPMDCWRQWIRHRTANVNEYSTRYSIAIDAAQTTPPDEWRSQSGQNRQGSGEYFDKKIGKVLSREEKKIHEQIKKIYKQRIDMGVAREQARKDLPLSTYTEAYWKIDLHNLLHFLELRMDIHAQLEIRSYANVIGNEIVARWVPVVWQAFQDYWMNAITYSPMEQEILKLMVLKEPEIARKKAEEYGWLNMKEGKLKINYERAEFEEKLKKMNLPIPWQDLI